MKSTKQSVLITAAAALGAVFGTGAASAADLPMKAPPPVAPAAVLSWTGFYAGFNIGGDWSNSDGVSHLATAGPCNAAFIGCTPTIPPTYSATLAAGSTFVANAGNGGRFTGGGQIGYNWQFGGGLAGIEADLNWLSKDNNNGVAFASTTVNSNFPRFPELYTGAVTRNLDWLGTFRGRLRFSPLLHSCFMEPAVSLMAVRKAPPQKLLLLPDAPGRGRPARALAGVHTRKLASAGPWVLAPNGCLPPIGA